MRSCQTLFFYLDLLNQVGCTCFWSPVPTGVVFDLHRLFPDKHIVFIWKLQLMVGFLCYVSGHMNSLFICLDPVKEVNSEVMNHSSSLKLKDGPAPIYQAGAGSIVCTGLIWNQYWRGGSCRMAETAQEMLGKKAGRGRAEMGHEMRNS